MRILFIGDIVGSCGRRCVRELVPALRSELAVDVVVANAENAAAGLGITERTARELFEAGCDALTLGNHAFRRAESYPYLDREERIARPANFPLSSPGRGYSLVEAAGRRLAVVNLCGTVFLECTNSPFVTVDQLLASLERQRVDHVLVDFHAEATSEKIAFGWYVDGRVTACVGTHTHVQTADERVLPGGTAYITDVGMTGGHGGVIGVRRAAALERFVRMTYARFEPTDEDPRLHGVLIDADGDGRARAIERVSRALST